MDPEKLFQVLLERNIVGPEDEVKFTTMKLDIKVNYPGLFVILL